MRILTLLLAIGTFTLVSAQDLTTPFLGGSWQSTYSNPALLLRLDQKITIGLPGLYNDFTSDNFTYNDLVTDDNIFDADRAIANIGDRNQLRNDLDVETVGFGWRSSKAAFGFSHRNRSTALVDFPKTLAQVIFQGNAQFIGQTVDIAPYFQIRNVNEFAFSAAFQLTDQIGFGGRVKYLTGAADLSSQAGQLELTTSDEIYQLQLNPDYVINAAGTIDYNGLDDVNTDIDFGRVDFSNLLRNSGLGFDLGLHFDFDGLRLQVSALDLGSSINWSEGVTNLSLDEVGEFEGLDVLQDILDDTTSLDGILDTLEERFNPKETNLSYTTRVGARYLLGGELDVTDQLTVGAMAHFQQFKSLEDFSEFSFALSARYAFGDILSVGGVYSFRPNSPVGIGVNALAQLGPVNLLLATDNVLAIADPRNSQQANLRVGLSLSFGGAVE